MDTKACADSNSYEHVLVVSSAIGPRKSGTTFCAVALHHFSVPNPPQNRVGTKRAANLAGNLRALSARSAGEQRATSEAGRVPASSLHARTASSVINAPLAPAQSAGERAGGEGRLIPTS